MQRSSHYDAEATELVGRAEAGRREAAELRARAAAHAASIDEIAGKLADIDAAAESSEREYEEQSRLQDERRAELASVRAALEAAVAEASRRAMPARADAPRRPPLPALAHRRQLGAPLVLQPRLRLVFALARVRRRVDVRQLRRDLLDAGGLRRCPRAQLRASRRPASARPTSSVASAS